MRLMVLWLFVAGLNSFNIAPDLSVYRKLLDQSARSSDTADQFYEQCKTIKEDSAPILLGFRAMSEILMCKHVHNPVSKLSHFKSGKRLLDYAISRAKDNPELIYFRFTTQSNVPFLLNYHSNLETDKVALIDYLGKEITDRELHSRIRAYLLNSKYCSAAEKEFLKTL